MRRCGSEGGDPDSYWDDTDLLRRHVWPLMRESVMHHDSFCCGRFDERAGSSRGFPSPRAGWEHVGSVHLPELKGELREIDVRGLRDAEECNK